MNWDWLWWLIFLGICGSTYLYCRLWYRRPSHLEPGVIVSRSHQTLKTIIDYHLQEEDKPISRAAVIEPYLKGRDLDRRQRRDVINFMVRANWLYPIPDGSGNSYVNYMVTAEGRGEVESAAILKQSAQGEYPYLKIDARGARGLIFSHIGNSGLSVSGNLNQVVTIREGATRLANALRADAMSTKDAKERNQAEELANQIDHAVTKDDEAMIDKLISRVNGMLQIANSAFPIAREVIQLIRR
jgi:hypothetical protein